jgi:hypothetical protein
MISTHLYFYKDVLIEMDIYLSKRERKNLNTSSLSQPHFGAKCEDETHTPKSGNLESFGTLENSELDYTGQNTSHWSFFILLKSS